MFGINNFEKNQHFIQNVEIVIGLGLKQRRREMLRFELPYPPSINHYYGRHGKITFIKPTGILYRQRTSSTLWGSIGRDGKWDGEPMDGDLMVEILVYPPDKRKRDIDNIKKALFDALQCAGLFENDYQICDDHTIRINKIVKGGLIDFRIQSAKGKPSVAYDERHLMTLSI